MAQIHREACFYVNKLGGHFRVPEGSPIWKGMGWAVLPFAIWMTPRWSPSKNTISYGKGHFRVLYENPWPPTPSLYVVEATNWRWPLWWLLLRGWLFLRWFERNLRLTAAVWGLLRCEVGAMPQWKDFVGLKK